MTPGAKRRASCAGALLLGALAACRSPAAGASPRWPAGHEIVVCGERFPVDAPVVLWSDEPRYDAYSEHTRFAPAGASGPRYRPGRAVREPELAARIEREGLTLATLREALDLFVLHYDACGTSQLCFRVLQDERALSVHFLLDVDGTLYQTLDLQETAWHARAANPRSIGIEIAHIGAYPPGERDALERWYEWTESGTRLTIPPELAPGLRWPDFAGRPARDGLCQGEIHGARYRQFDFTPEQYRSLAALTATLVQIFPRIELEVPRDARGSVRTDALSAQESEHFHGILGHYHLQQDKRDPGPAFDWERLLEQVRERLAPPARP